MRPLVLLALVAGCGNDVVDDIAIQQDLAGAADLSATVDLAMASTSDGGLIAARPYMFHVPTGYDKSKPTPLVVLLHGYTASGALQESYFNLTAVSDAHTFLYAYPDGLQDQGGNRYWNATDACCDLYHTNVDDVAYINAVIDDMEKKYNVDPKRVYLVGHSNGGFMSHRMACDSSTRIAAIVSLAGVVWEDMAKCKPTDPVAVLQVHGDADAVIAYNGGAILGNAFPSAHATVQYWAAHDGCMMTPDTSAPALDLDSGLLGNETKVERWLGCKDAAVELWTIQGGSHVPALHTDPKMMPTWGELIWGFLSAHPKP